MNRYKQNVFGSAVIERAEANLPPYPTEIIEKLGAFPRANHNDWFRQGKPQFAGWLWEVGGCWNGYVPNNVSVSLSDLSDDDIPEGVNLVDIGYAGFWRVRTQSKSGVVYCTLPSFKIEHVEPRDGKVEENNRIRIGWKQEDIDAMVLNGYELIMAEAAKDGEYVGE
jgi:hypothetical protein